MIPVPECGVISAAAMYGLRVGGIAIALMDLKVCLCTASIVPAYLCPVDSSMGDGCWMSLYCFSSVLQKPVTCPCFDSVRDRIDGL